MEDRLTDDEGDPSEQTAAQSYGDIFDKLFPQYLVMGMTPEQYWDGESSLKPAFREAYRIRMENEERIRDRQNWYMGQYLICAMRSVALLVNGFVPKGVEPEPYPEKPFLEQAEEKKREENRKKQEENQMQYAMAMFQAQIAQFNKRFEQRKKAEGAASGP